MSPAAFLPLGIRSPVCGLLLPRGPAAVAGFVIAVVVDAIQRQARRWFAHILEEGLEAVPPPGADGDPAPAVILKRFFVRVVAALHHSVPSAVRMAWLAVPIMPVSSSRPAGVTAEAAARSGMAIAQSDTVHAGPCPAVAQAMPSPAAVLIAIGSAGGQAAKALTCDIIKPGQGGCSISCCVKWRPALARRPLRVLSIKGGFGHAYPMGSRRIFRLRAD